MTADDRIDRTLVATLFALALGCANLGAGGGFATRTLGAVVGLLLALGLVRLWGERVRPKSTLGWTVVLTIALAVGVAGGVGGSLPIVLGTLVGLFVVHDLRLAPSLLLALPIAAALLQPDKHWPSATDDEAWWVAGAATLGLAAALFERERLARRVGSPVPAVWTLVRLGFVVLWTAAVLLAKKDLQAGAIFGALGFEIRGVAGQVFLVGVIVLCLVVTGLVLRSKPKRDGVGPP